MWDTSAVVFADMLWASAKSDEEESDDGTERVFVPRDFGDRSASTSEWAGTFATCSGSEDGGDDNGEEIGRRVTLRLDLASSATATATGGTILVNFNASTTDVTADVTADGRLAR